MKRKPAQPPATESAAAPDVVAPQILAGARRLLASENLDPGRNAVKCVVCSAETPAGSADRLCWVCRRLKISAWRDVEQQLPAQE